MKIPRCIRITAFMTCAIFSFTTVAQSAPSHYFAPQPRAQVLAHIIDRGGDPALLDEKILSPAASRTLDQMTVEDIRALYDEDGNATHSRAVLGANHMRRVSHMVHALGRHLGLNPRLLKPLTNAALVHDLNDMGRFDKEERARLRERSRAIMRRYVAVPKDPRRSRVIDFLSRQTGLGREYFTENVYEKAINQMLQREKVIGREREDLRDMMMVEANHERYALEVLKRKNIHLTQLEEWLILHHREYIDFSDEADRKTIEDLALYHAVDVDELILALDIFVLTDVFENFINRRRLIEYRGMDPLTLKEGMDRVSYKIKWMESRFGTDVRQAMIDLLYDQAGRAMRKTSFYHAAAEARGVDDFTIAEIEELFDAYYGSQQPVHEELSPGRFYYDVQENDHPMLYAKRILVAGGAEDAALLESRNARALLLPDGKYLVRESVASDSDRLLRAVVHEDIEALLQIMQRTVGEAPRVLPFTPDTYQQIREMVLEAPGLFAWYTENVLQDTGIDLPTDLIVNDIVARSFEALFARDELGFATEDLGIIDMTLLRLTEPLINARRHSLFTAEFFDWHARGKILRHAFQDGAVFRQTGQFPWSGQSGHTYLKSPFSETKPNSFALEDTYETARIHAAESEHIRRQQIAHIQSLAKEKNSEAITTYFAARYQWPVREAARDALKELGALTPERTLILYTEEIYGPYPLAIREKAVRRLSELKSTAIPELEKVLQHDNRRLRDAASETLEKMGAFSASRKLIRYRKDILSGSFDPESTTLDELAALGARALGELELLLTHESADVVARVVAILADISRTPAPVHERVRGRIVFALERVLDHASGAVRDSAAEALEVMGELTEARRLIRYRKDIFSAEFVNVQKALYELVHLGSKALPLLDDVLRNGERDVRRLAAETLGRIADPRMVPALILSLNDVGEVRYAARKALQKITRTNPGAFSALDSAAAFMLSFPVLKATLWAIVCSAGLFALTLQVPSLSTLLPLTVSFTVAALPVLLPLVGILAIEYGTYGMVAHVLYSLEKSKAQRIRNQLALETKRIMRQESIDTMEKNILAETGSAMLSDEANTQLEQLRARMDAEKKDALLSLEAAISKDDYVRVRMFLSSNYTEVRDAAATALSLNPLSSEELVAAVDEAEKTGDREKLFYLRTDPDPDVRHAAGLSLLRLLGADPEAVKDSTHQTNRESTSDESNQAGSVNLWLIALLAAGSISAPLLFASDGVFSGARGFVWLIGGGLILGAAFLLQTMTRENTATSDLTGLERESAERKRSGQAAQIEYIKELQRSRNIDELIARINDERGHIAQAALMALVEIGSRGSDDERARVLQLFEAALKTGHPHARVSIITALGQIYEGVSEPALEGQRIIDIFAHQLRMGDSETRFHIVKKMGEISERFDDPTRNRIIALLEHALGDWNTALRRAAAEALGVVGKSGEPGVRARIVTVLEEAVNNGDSFRSRGALLGLGEIGAVASSPTQQSIITILERSFLTGRYDERRISAHALARMAATVSGSMPARIIGFFEHALGAGDFDLRIVAISALGHVGKAAGPNERGLVFLALNKALDNESSYLRALAVTELAALNDPRAIAALIVRLKDEEPVRMAAIKALRALQERNPAAFSFDDKLALFLLTNPFLKATGLYAAIGLPLLAVLIIQPAALMVLPFFAVLASGPLAITLAVTALAVPVYSLYALIAYFQYRYHDTGAALTIDEIKAEKTLMSDESKKHIPFDDSIAFAIIKPDGYVRRGEILEALQAAGFEILLQKEKRFPVPEAKNFYAEHKGRLHFPRLIAYMTSGPVMQLILRRHGDRPAWQVLREKVGATSGQETGTLRNIFGTEKITHKDGTVTIKNRIHCSDSLESVAREIGFIDEVALENEPRTHTKILRIGSTEDEAGSQVIAQEEENQAYDEAKADGYQTRSRFLELKGKSKAVLKNHGKKIIPFFVLFAIGTGFYIHNVHSWIYTVPYYKSIKFPYLLAKKRGDVNEFMPALVKALSNKNSRVRKTAAEELGKIGDSRPDPRAVPGLIVALRDEDHSVRAAAAESLGLYDRSAVPGLIVALTDEYDTVRMAAAEALGLIGDSSAVPELIAALRDENDDVRAAAAQALSWIEDSRAVPELIAALTDEYFHVRQNAAEALGLIKDSRAVPELIAALRDENDGVQAAAAEALGRIGDGRAVPELIVALTDEYFLVRETVVEALSLLRDTRAVPGLVTALTDEYYGVRLAAAEALGLIGDSRAVPGLVTVLTDNFDVVRANAAEALGQIGNSRAVPDLLATLREDEPLVRRYAAEALGCIGDSRAVPELILALRDEYPVIRMNAVEALGLIGDSNAVAGLITVLADEYNADEERAAAAEILARIGDSNAVIGLITALRAKNFFVVEAAAEGLIRIGKESVPELITVLSDEKNGEQERVVAAEVLGAIGDTRAVPALISALGTENPYVRADSAEALGRIGDSRALSALKAALSDMDSYVRESVQEAILKIESKNARPPAKERQRNYKPTQDTKTLIAKDKAYREQIKPVRNFARNRLMGRTNQTGFAQLRVLAGIAGVVVLGLLVAPHVFDLTTLWIDPFSTLTAGALTAILFGIDIWAIIGPVAAIVAFAFWHKVSAKRRFLKRLSKAGEYVYGVPREYYELAQRMLDRFPRDVQIAEAVFLSGLGGDVHQRAFNRLLALGARGSFEKALAGEGRYANIDTDAMRGLQSLDAADASTRTTTINKEKDGKGYRSFSFVLPLFFASVASLPVLTWAADPALEVMRQYGLSVDALHAVRDMYWSEWSPVLYISLFVSAISGAVAVVAVRFFRGSAEKRHKKNIVQKVKENYPDILKAFPARTGAADDTVLNHALRLYTHHSPYVRAYSVYQLAELAHPDAEMVMKRLLLNETADDPLQALLYGIENAALDRMHQAVRSIIKNQVNNDPAAIEAELTSDQATVRGFAADALASMRAYDSLPALQDALLNEEDESNALKIARACEKIENARRAGNTSTSAGIVKIIIPASVTGLLLHASNATASDFFSVASEWIKTNDMRTAFFAFSSLALMYVSGHLVFRNIFPRLLMKYKDKLVAQGSASSYVRYGAVSRFFGRTDEALAAAEKARALNPYWSDSYKMLGEMYEEKGDYEKALTHYGRALEFPKWSGHIRTRLNYIEMLEKTGKIDEARQAFDSLLRSMPDSIDVISALSAFLARHESTITADPQLRAELARQKSRSAFLSLKTHSTSLIHMITSDEKDNGIDYKGILVAAGVFSVWLAVMGLTMITVISGALVASIASSLARRLGLIAAPGVVPQKYGAAVQDDHMKEAADKPLRDGKSHTPLRMAAAEEKESRLPDRDVKIRPVVVKPVNISRERGEKQMPTDSTSAQAVPVVALSTVEEQALSFAEKELLRLFKREFRDELKKQLSLSIKPGIKDLARYTYDERASRAISITFSRAALGNELVAAAEGVHEYIHHFFEKQFVGSTLGLMHVQAGREIPLAGHTVVYARELKDLVATVIKLRYLITAAFDMDSARSIELEREIAPGTAYAELLRFLGSTDDELSDVSKMQLKHMLNRFQNTWGMSLEKQIAAVQEIVSLKPYAAESGSALTSDDIKDMADFIRDVEERLFEYGTFDARLEKIAERILKKDGHDFASFGTALSEKRAVIIDSTEIGALDAALIGSLIGEDRALFAVSENELYEVHVQNGRIMTGGSLLRVSGLDEAARALEAQSFTVSVVTGAENARARFGEKLMRRDSVLLFSTEHARKELGQNVPALFALETVVLPYAFHMQREQLIKQSGSGRVFHQAGRIFSLNPGYIARFGDTLETSFSRIMDSIKIAVAEIHARRAIDIAA
jgi:HEAT repeat protein/nucleoside diphosphate kinase/tetratricopeptide (TPR) repeat protein